MAAKIEFHPSVANDIMELKIDPVSLAQIKDRIFEAVSDFESKTSSIRGLSQQFRKLKFSDKRIVIWKSKDTYYVLKLFHRRQGYSRESIQKLMSLVREYSG